MLFSVVAPVAHVAPLVFLSAVGKQFIVSVKSLSAETTFGVALEAALVHRPRVVVAISLVLLELLWREELVLVSEYLLVPRAQIAGNCMSAPLLAVEYHTILTT